MSNKSFDIKRTMSIDDYAYVKGIHKDLVNLRNVEDKGKKNKLNDWQVMDFIQLGLTTILHYLFCDNYSLHIFVLLN